MSGKSDDEEDTFDYKDRDPYIIINCKLLEPHRDLNNNVISNKKTKQKIQNEIYSKRAQDRTRSSSPASEKATKTENNRSLVFLRSSFSA